jgi:PAS domain S-box-containing protein
MLKGEIDYCPLPLMSKNGARIPVETRVWFGKWNGQDCIFGISKNLSVQQAALEKFQKLFDNNPALMAISAIPSRTFIHVNKAFLNKLAYDYNEIIGHSAEELNLFLDSEKQLSFANELLHNGRIQDLELQIRTKNNEILTGLFSGEVFENQLEMIYLTVMTDITAQKMAEEKIRKQKEQLEQLNAEKDKFYSIISHDLRSPFQSILGYTQLMADDWPSLKKDELQKMVLTLRTSAINLHRLLENLLEWSHLHQGVTAFSIESFFLTPKIKECIELFNDSLTKKNIELINDIPTDLKVNADIHMFETVCRNLLSNAIKFTPRGGKIILTAQERSGHLAEISFSDTGIGMDETLISNLFRLDIKTNRKGTEKEPSTGLGLIICKEFIEKHGGKLCIDSKEGLGSRFYFTLPLS